MKITSAPSPDREDWTSADPVVQYNFLCAKIIIINTENILSMGLKDPSLFTSYFILGTLVKNN